MEIIKEEIDANGKKHIYVKYTEEEKEAMKKAWEKFGKDGWRKKQDSEKAD